MIREESRKVSAQLNSVQQKTRIPFDSQSSSPLNILQPNIEKDTYNPDQPHAPGWLTDYDLYPAKDMDLDTQNMGLFHDFGPGIDSNANLNRFSNTTHTLPEHHQLLDGSHWEIIDSPFLHLKK